MKKFSGANFCFWVSVSVVFILVLFCLCFCFSIWFFVPENVSRRFASSQVRFLNRFSGANFCIWQPYCQCVAFPPSRRGKCCPFFFLFLFLGSGSLSFVVFFRSSFLRVAVWKNFRERTFVFVCRCWSCVFWCCFAYVFALFLFFFRSRKCLKKFS